MPVHSLQLSCQCVWGNFLLINSRLASSSGPLINSHSSRMPFLHSPMSCWIRGIALYLITSAHIVLSTSHMDTLGNIRRLLLDGHQQVQRLVVESCGPHPHHHNNSHMDTLTLIGDRSVGEEKSVSTNHKRRKAKQLRRILIKDH